ncbi:hypothetical protein SAMN05216354_2175 [Xylanibacter ruminicola]|uniref:Lipoprotein n=1 Tax=Xylanibacter ruminicola TaxID=839 RepID=A0A1H5W0W8_XYLRU|nr:MULTISPECIES: hypothetical protein [Prevotellaceae]SEF93169.1 hypothetical protein SAMN05216354_2175 [Xylanibacter ruminicola]SEV80500.1 hypothetical protein SAMN04487827_0087 [Prevotella sp. khp7]
MYKRISNFLRNCCAKNPVSVTCLLFMAIVMGCLINGDIYRMNNAETPYDYWQNLCYLTDNLARTYFFLLYLLLAYLIYINKQYTRWCVWLYYIMAASCLVYCAIAGYMLDYGVSNSLAGESPKNVLKLAGTLYQGPFFCMIIFYFFVPKFLKDTMKLKEEQDLTI